MTQQGLGPLYSNSCKEPHQAHSPAAFEQVPEAVMAQANMRRHFPERSYFSVVFPDEGFCPPHRALCQWDVLIRRTDANAYQAQ